MGCREDVWLALSELWLDTELDQPALRQIAVRLCASGLSRRELQHIYHYEVAPQVWLNHWAVAGVWDVEMVRSMLSVAACLFERANGSVNLVHTWGWWEKPSGTVLNWDKK